MKFAEDKTRNLVKGETFEKVQSTIDAANLSKMYTILSNLYKNPIGSIVREYSSNAWDATVEAGNDGEPITVRIVDSDEGYFVEFEDFGVGLSSERLNNIYFNYGSTTKDQTNALIGGFGLGAKSFLSYTDSFEIRSRHDGIESAWIMSKQADGIPAGEKLYEQPTDKRNGTRIRGLIKDSYDKRKFEEECLKQLAYFPNIYFEGQALENDFQLIEGNHFTYRTGAQPFDEMHICLGHVAYPISWAELSIPRINIPVALKFSIGELIPTPSREDIEYSRGSVEVLNDKIELAIKELQSRYDKQTDYTDDFVEYIESNNEVKRYLNFTDEVKLDLNEDHNSISPVLSYRATSFKPFKGTELEKWYQDHKWFSRNFVDVRKECSLKTTKKLAKNSYLGKANSSGYPNWFGYNSEIDDKRTPLFRIANDKDHDKFKTAFIIEDWLKPSFNRNKFYTYQYKKYPFEHWLALLNIVIYRDNLAETKAAWEARITKLIQQMEGYVREFLKAHSHSYKSFTVTDDWIDAYKASSKLPGYIRTEDEVPAGVFTLQVRNDGGCTTYEKRTNSVNLKPALISKTQKVIYGTRKELDLLAGLAFFRYTFDIPQNTSEMHYKRNVAIYTVSQTNKKVMALIPNAISIEDYMSTEYKQLSRLYFTVKHGDAIAAASNKYQEMMDLYGNMVPEHITEAFQRLRYWDKKVKRRMSSDWEPFLEELHRLYHKAGHSYEEEFESLVDTLETYYRKIGLVAYLMSHTPTYLKVEYAKAVKIRLHSRFYTKFEPETEEVAKMVIDDIEQLQKDIDSGHFTYRNGLRIERNCNETLDALHSELHNFNDPALKKRVLILKK